MSDPHLLDTSAMLAYLEAEAGGLRVRELLSTERILLPFVVALEVHYITLQERGADAAERRLAAMRALPALWLTSVDEPTLLAASRFKAAHRLSFADALVAGFAFAQGAILVHKDPEFEAVAGEVRQERLPYKQRRTAP